MPAALRARHAQRRSDYARAPTVRPMGSGGQQRGVRKDGSEFPAEVSLSPVRSAGGHSVIAAVRDLSERQRMETAIRESAITLESIGDAVVSTDEAGRVRLMNRVAEALTGWSAEDARGQPLDEVVVLLDERTGDALRPSIERLLGLSGRPDLIPPMVLRSRSGVDHPIADSVARITDAAGQIRGAVLVFRDVAESRRTDLLLRRSRRELQEIVDKLPEGVLITDGPIIVFANPTFDRSLGYEPGALAGRRLDELVAPQDRALVVASPLMRSDPASGPEQRLELRFLRKDSSTATLAVTLVQAIEFEGRPARLSLARDVTEQRQMQAQLILADRMLSVGVLAAGLAHEINNPLTAVVANLGFAIDAVRRPPCADVAEGLGREILEDLLEAQQAADRVRSIVRDVKVLAHSDQDQRWPVDVNQVLDASARIASTELRRGVRVVKQYSELPPVQANESRLGQVFVNLIVNAFQAIPEGKQPAEVGLTTRLEPPNRVVVAISDSGHGMSPEVLARLFTPFFTTKPTGVGTGLGLSISQAIVQGLGGEITAESVPGVGSVFSVRLPAAAPTRASARPVVMHPVPAPPAPPAPPAATLPRVLVVDDEPVVGKVLARLLAADHDVTVVTSGAEALAHIADSGRWDAIVCDLMMPAMTGIELYAAVSRTAPDLARRMVFMTGGTVVEHDRDFIDRVGIPCLEKPFGVERLRALIAQRGRVP